MTDLDVVKVLTAIEEMAKVYDLEKTTLADFVRDVKHCNALFNFLHSVNTENLNKYNIIN